MQNDSLKTEEKEIDGHLFAVKQLAGRKVVKLNNKLARLIVPALAKFDKGLDRTDTAQAAQAIQVLMDNLSEAEVDMISTDLFANVTLDGKPFDGKLQDIVFAGSASTYYKLLYFCLEVNLRDFFSVLAAKLAAIFPKGLS